MVHKITEKCFGVYRGEVVDNFDPETRGRVRVQVPMLFDNDGIWALPCIPIGRDVENSTDWLPDIGDMVWLLFEGGDGRFPVWIGTAPGS
jgi:hypothetical protein